MERPARQTAVSSRNYRSFVGGPNLYDLIGALQFNLLVLLGMREAHTLLDIGCGSLRGGRFSIVYLQAGHYFGIEPESWLVEEGIKQNLGSELAALKQPSFLYDSDFTCTSLGRTFDFIIAHSIFSHAAPAQIERCLSEVVQTMRPGSLFLATYNQGGSSYTGTEWKYPSVGYTKEAFHGMAKDHGLVTGTLQCYHPGGQTWVLLAPRSSAGRLNRIVSSISLQSPVMPAPPLNRAIDVASAG